VGGTAGLRSNTEPTMGGLRSDIASRLRGL
jgi:hypothetical protein